MKYLFILLFSFLPFAATATTNLQDMTWVEINSAIKNGATTVIIPTGGTEQNGPHMITGKHNYIVAYAAEKIAEKVGNTLVAPVMAYVPEGSITPPEGHMKYAGTISLREETFANVLEDTARSFKQHGFKLICFLGDSGGNQNAQQKVAEQLSDEWKKEGVKVISVNNYYNNNQDEYLLKQKFTKQEIGTHASMEDTSELMVINKAGIRKDQLDKGKQENGVYGSPQKATPEIGKLLLDIKINAAVEQIKKNIQ